MRIYTGFDESQLTKYIKKTKPTVFYITWEHDGTYYPDKKWDDFGEVILGWWLNAALRLARGTDEDEFVFMDGPFFIKARYDRETDIVELAPDGLDVVWKIPFKELTAEIIRAARQTTVELKRNGIPEKELLGKKIEVLQEILTAKS